MESTQLYRTGLFIANLLFFISLILATFFTFFALSNITTPTTASTVVVSNNESARTWLLSAGVTGVIILIIIVFYYLLTAWAKPVGDSNDPMSISSGPSGGLLIMDFILFIALIFMLVLIFMGLSYLDSTVTGSQTARNYAIAAIIAGIFAFFFVMAVIFMDFYNYYYYSVKVVVKDGAVVAVKDGNVVVKDGVVVKEVIQPVQPVQPVVAPANLDNIFYLSKIPNRTGKFNGTIELKGTLTEPKKYIDINGIQVENLNVVRPTDISLKFPINELEQVKRPVILQPQQVRK